MVYYTSRFTISTAKLTLHRVPALASGDSARAASWHVSNFGGNFSRQFDLTAVSHSTERSMVFATQETSAIHDVDRERRVGPPPHRHGELRDGRHVLNRSHGSLGSPFDRDFSSAAALVDAFQKLRRTATLLAAAEREDHERRIGWREDVLVGSGWIARTGKKTEGRRPPVETKGRARRPLDHAVAHPCSVGNQDLGGGKPEPRLVPVRWWECGTRRACATAAIVPRDIELAGIRASDVDVR